MADVTMMRCIMPHWQGMDFVPLGAMFPEGDPKVIPAYFESTTLHTAEPKPTPKKTTAKKQTG